MSDIALIANPNFVRRRLILLALMLTGLLMSVAIVVLQNQHLLEAQSQPQRDQQSATFNITAQDREQIQAEFDAREEQSRAAAASPLHWAIQKDDHSVFLDGLANLENIGAHDQSGNSALHEAVGHQRFAYSVALLLMGANPQFQNADWHTPYYLLVSRKVGGTAIDRFRRLLEHRFSNVPPERRKNQAEFIVAVAYDDVSLLSEVLAQGVLVNEPWGPDGDSALHHVASAKAAEHLIGAGANVNAQDHSGGTPLIAAVKARNDDLVRHLLRAGADVNVRDNRGLSALTWAIKDSRSSLSPAMSVLLNYDSEVGLNEWRDAVEAQNARALRLLFQHGATFAVDSPDGEQILRWAQMNGRPRVTAALDDHETIGPAARQRAKRQSRERDQDLASIAGIITPHLAVFFCFVSVVPLLFGLMFRHATTNKLFIWSGTVIATMLATYLAFFPLDIQEVLAAARWSNSPLEGFLLFTQVIVVALSALSALIVLALLRAVVGPDSTHSMQRFQPFLISALVAFVVLALHHFERIDLLDRTYWVIVGDPQETIAASGLFEPPKRPRRKPASSKPDDVWIDHIDPDRLREMESALQSGNDPNVKNRSGSAALHLAVSKRNLPLVELLLKYGADTELRDKKNNTALNVALYDGNRKATTEIISLLLKTGSDPNAPGSEQILPLCRLMAQEKDYSDYTEITAVANLLLDAGAGINHEGCAPLHFTRVPNRIEWLLAKGADLEAKAGLRRQGRTEYGRFTPLWNAVYSSDIPLVEAFLKAGADVNVQDSVTGYTPLHVALARVRYKSTPKPEHLSIINMLLASGADPDIIAYDGTTIAALDALQITKVSAP